MKSISFVQCKFPLQASRAKQSSQVQNTNITIRQLPRSAGFQENRHALPCEKARMMLTLR